MKTGAVSDKLIFLKRTNSYVQINRKSAEVSKGKYLRKAENQTLVDSLESDFYQTLKDTYWFQPWGADNMFPRYLLNLIDKNFLAWQNIEKIANFVTGYDYTLCYKIRKGKSIELQFIDNDQEKEVWDWLERNNWQEVATKILMDFIAFGNAPVEFIRSADGEQIAEIAHIDTTLCRIGQFDYAPVDFQIGEWNYYGGINTIKRPALDETNPTKFAQSILYLKGYRGGKYRYSPPFYLGAETFLKLQNKIPAFHLGGLTNGYLIRYQIDMPEDYFDAEDDPEQAEIEFRESLDNFLASPENAGKNLLTFYPKDALGKKQDGVTITAIQAELHDEAFKTIFDQSMIAVQAAFGIAPETGGVTMQGGMSGNSGRAMDAGAKLFALYNVPTLRDFTIHKIFNLLKKANGWNKDLYIHHIDSIIEKNDTPIP